MRPRTNDKDPVSKLKYYKAWIVFNKSDKGTVVSAYCFGKGGGGGMFLCHKILSSMQ